MSKNKYKKILSEKITDDFTEAIPQSFIENINKSFKITSSHYEQLKGIHQFYNMIRICHPEFYLSKSRICVGDQSMGFCKNPYVFGTIENAILLLEKQYFDVLYLLFGGAYRPITVILRYMLELTTWISASIINKKILTKKTEDSNKSMSQFEFEYFLNKNLENIEKIKSSSTPAKEKLSINTIQGIVKIPGEYLHKLTNKEVRGLDVIKNLHSQLSKYAHANIWNQIRLDKDGRTNIEKTGLLIGSPTYEGYHQSLKYIIDTHEIIFYLLIMSSYENIGYYHNSLAKEFYKSISLEFKQLPTSLRFVSIENLIQSPVEIKRDSSITDIEHEIGPIFDDGHEDEENQCPSCGTRIFFSEEICGTCQYYEYGGNSSDHVLF